MTRQHFQAMAEIVKAINEGEWTSDLPAWAEASNGRYWGNDTNTEDNYRRAVQTAEAFIILSRRFNPLFNQDVFLQACGLKAQPAKRRKA